MKILDRYIQRLRILKALADIPKNSRVLDIGCAEGDLFKIAGNKIKAGIGIDPDLKEIIQGENYILYPGFFPQSLPIVEEFDVITMLAVLEHLGLGEQRQLAEVISTWLMPQGKLILTVPSSKVDAVLKIMKSLGLIDGMSVDEHHGFNASDVPLIFNFSGLSLVKNEKFQFGLNNLFIFEHRA